MLLGIKGRLDDHPEAVHDGFIEVLDFAAGSALYSKLRDESGEGQSTWPDGRLLGTREYRISYNGKVWDGDELLYNPYA